MRFALSLCATLLAASPALAQHDHMSPAAPGASMPMHDHGAATPAAPASSPVVKAFNEANEKMHRDMNAPLTGDADHDFVVSMIPHHQGAIDMAKIVLQYGRDPELRKLAEDVVSAQEKEITQMKAWLARERK